MVNNPYASLNQQPQSMNISKSSYLNLKPNTNLPVSQNKPAFVGPELPKSQNIISTTQKSSIKEKAKETLINLTIPALAGVPDQRIFPEQSIAGKTESFFRGIGRTQTTIVEGLLGIGQATGETIIAAGEATQDKGFFERVKENIQENPIPYYWLAGAGTLLVSASPFGRAAATGAGAAIGSFFRGDNVNIDMPKSDKPITTNTIAGNQPYPMQNQPITPLYEQSVVPTTPSVDNVPVVPVGTQTISTTKKKRRKAKVKQVPNIRINNVVAGKLLYSRGYLR